MEYLSSIDDSLIKIDEKKYKFFNIEDYPQFFYGSNPFLKVSETFFDTDFDCGNRICFSTSSDKVIFKIQLNNEKMDYQLCDWNSRGFDVYIVEDNIFYHKTVIAPFGKNNIFSDVISNVQNKNLCIFLPNFSQVEKMYIGIEIDANIKEVQFYKYGTLFFLGNSVTQGASVSRSGISYPNIISRNLNRNISLLVNKIPDCLNKEFANELLKTEYTHIIIYISLDKNYEKNYSNISAFFNEISKYFNKKTFIYLIDDIFYEKNINRNFTKLFTNNNQNVTIYLSHLFDKSEIDYIVYDKNHFSDYAMQIIAQKLSEYIS
ncbi:SGNH/GDSL hydrolase N-terminal domain-containing protein [Methanosphaera sp.]|uniref:SGNH/GDSL hydrolase N-terminal domain-containing protein n=1 Tax=Methanosphaera sp. TaxID=2666342 RepID=UPI002E7A783A|nr:SGNH/GDSL hydrolase N-terminal domain-containing protein [Methanosphaera sp.]MEE1117194.1 SGNH/GDSL hydrolase N-terminal domain-containing protein [Methanosphaera sp.]